MRIICPHCGSRGIEEFTCHRAAPGPRPADDAPVQAWVEFVYVQDNPCGLVDELWQHVLGCRAWLVVSRDTLTHEVSAVRLASEAGR